MDYVEAFKNLRTNNKYGRKSPHKAVMMLTVIKLYEQSILTDNEIFYNDTLKSMFLKVWNKVLPNEPLYHPEAYLPFWYLQNDSFWHIMPIRGKEDILSLMRDTNIKPSEAKLSDSVRCAELDDDLYFLMTIASGRSALKRALLETYTTLSEKQIDRLAESTDNATDYSLSAMNEYEKILSSADNNEKKQDISSSNELIQQFRKLSDDLQIALNYEYFAFLKNHRSERDMLREVCPNVYTLYDCIANHHIQRTDISPSFAFIYDNFLSDLKIALMSENGSMELIDKIDAAIAILRGDAIESDETENHEHVDTVDVEAEQEEVPDEDDEVGGNNLEVEHVYLDSSYNVVKTIMTSSLDDAPKKEETPEGRKGKAWTQEEEERITHYFERGIAPAEIAERVGRTEVAVKCRLAKLGLIEYTYGQDMKTEEPVADKVNSQDDFKIENSFTRCYILNKNGEKVFSADGKLKFIHGKLYRLNLKDECFTIKDMKFNGEVWMKGGKKIVAYSRTKLYWIIGDALDYCDVIEDIVDCPVFNECKLKVNGEWYNYKGELVTKDTDDIEESNVPSMSDSDKQRIVKHPLYEVRKQAILRALGYFKLPTKIRDIARTISRTAWGAPIREDVVEEIIDTIKEVESSDGKYSLRRKQ